MVASKTFPCLSLQTVTKCIGIIDLGLGLLNFVVMLFRLKEATEKRYLQFTLDFVTEHGISLGTFPALNSLPLEFAIASLVCYAVEFNLGALLFIGAAKKNLSVVYFWIVVSAGTASFTGVFIRLYEIVTVYDYARQLKDEEVISSINAHYQQRQSQTNFASARRGSRRHPNTFYTNDGLRDQLPPQYEDTSNIQEVVKEDPPPPSYEEAMEMTLKWIYGKRGMTKTLSLEEEEHVKNFKA